MMHKTDKHSLSVTTPHYIKVNDLLYSKSPDINWEAELNSQARYITIQTEHESFSLQTYCEYWASQDPKGRAIYNGMCQKIGSFSEEERHTFDLFFQQWVNAKAYMFPTTAKLSTLFQALLSVTPQAGSCTINDFKIIPHFTWLFNPSIRALTAHEETRLIRLTSNQDEILCITAKTTILITYDHLTKKWIADISATSFTYDRNSCDCFNAPEPLLQKLISATTDVRDILNLPQCSMPATAYIQGTSSQKQPIHTIIWAWITLLYRYLVRLFKPRLDSWQDETPSFWTYAEQYTCSHSSSITRQEDPDILANTP